MASFAELKLERLKKIDLLRAKSLDPYPVAANPDYPLGEVSRLFTKLSQRKKLLTVVGRVWSRRGQGGLIFVDLVDGAGKLQALLKLGEVSQEEFILFENVVDRGDFVEFVGKLFLTKRGEKTILIKSWRMLAKSLRPWPDNWHGLVGIEERFRRRYLDVQFNEEVGKRFLLRSSLIKTLRYFLDEAGYLEVETPILQSLAGGASAKPFRTHHDALDLDVFLRISPELYLKKMLVAGFSKVYELSRCFRNEGIDVTHHPEFTMLEFYEAYSDATKQQQLVELLFKNLAKQFGRASTIAYGEHKIDFRAKFRLVTYYDLFRRYALIAEPETISDKDLALKAAQLGITPVANSKREKLLDQIYKKVCRPKIIQPTFVVDYPKNYLPLAKAKAVDPSLADAWQLLAGGLELVKAFSELNDPVEQRARFVKEEKNRAAGDLEAQSMDEEYLEAMEYGLPPAGGVGIGIDRLVMLFSDTANIREVIFFPTLRPKS